MIFVLAFFSGLCGIIRGAVSDYHVVWGSDNLADLMGVWAVIGCDIFIMSGVIFSFSSCQRQWTISVSFFFCFHFIL